MTDIPLQDLPYWMRQARRGIDWGNILALIFGLIAAWPFMTQPGLPHTNASENYVYRTADYATAIREGRLYPRWSPHVLGGYGAPIPHYYPPLPAYLPALLEVLLTDDSVTSVRLVYVLSLTLSCFAIYRLVSRGSGASAGLLAAALFALSPYPALTAPHILGDLPGVMALALIATLLWSVDSFMTVNHPVNIFLVSVAAAGLCLTSVRAYLLGMVLALIFVGWNTLIHKRRKRGVLAACILGTGIAGFYWIPALLELDSVRWQTFVQTIPPQLNLTDFFTPLAQIDLNELKHSPQFTLGLVIIPFLLAGIITLIRTKQVKLTQSLFLFLGLLLTIAALVFFPAEVWLLGPITLCLAVGASSVMLLRAKLPTHWQRLFLPTLLIFIFMASSSVWLAPQWSATFGDTDGLAQIRYEQQGYGTAVLPSGMPMPSTIAESLPLSRLLIEAYQSNSINKIAPIQAGIISHNSHNDLIQLRASTPTILQVLTAYFPGWQASINGSPVPLSRNPETGLILVNLPSTREGQVRGGDLFITLGSTPIRAGAWIISWCLLSLTLILTWGRFRRYSGDTLLEMNTLLTLAEVRLLSAVIIALFIILYVSTGTSPLLGLRAAAGHHLRDALFVQARTNVGLSLPALRLERTNFRPNDHIDLTIYWQTQRVLPENYQTQVYLLNSVDGSKWSTTDFRHPGGYPTQLWSSNRYISDPYQLTVPGAIPAGSYQLVVEAFMCKPACLPENRLAFFDSQGQPLGPVFILPFSITIGN